MVSFKIIIVGELGIIICMWWDNIEKGQDKRFNASREI